MVIDVLIIKIEHDRHVFVRRNKLRWNSQTVSEIPSKKIKEGIQIKKISGIWAGLCVGGYSQGYQGTAVILSRWQG